MSRLGDVFIEALIGNVFQNKELELNDMSTLGKVMYNEMEV